MLSKPWEDKKFKDFKLFWDGEVSKILFRCAKEVNCYASLKKLLRPKYYADSPNELFYLNYYAPSLRNLREHEKDIFCLDVHHNAPVCIRQFPVISATKYKRHLSLVIAIRILEHCGLYYNELNEATFLLEKELYKGHKIGTFFCDRFYYLKLFFKI